MVWSKEENTHRKDGILLMQQHDTKLWLAKVHKDVMDEANIRQKIVRENEDLIYALEWVIDVFTNGDPQWHDVPCIENARKVLYK
jgi:hypothetical protein